MLNRPTVLAEPAVTTGEVVVAAAAEGVRVVYLWYTAEIAVSFALDPECVGNGGIVRVVMKLRQDFPPGHTWVIVVAGMEAELERSRSEPPCVGDGACSVVSSLAVKSGRLAVLVLVGVLTAFVFSVSVTGQTVV